MLLHITYNHESLEYQIMEAKYIVSQARRQPLLCTQQEASELMHMQILRCARRMGGAVRYIVCKEENEDALLFLEHYQENEMSMDKGDEYEMMLLEGAEFGDVPPFLDDPKEETQMHETEDDALKNNHSPEQTQIRLATYAR